MAELKKDIPDVDIDVQNRRLILDDLHHIEASIHRSNEIERHKSGVYFQPIPKDHISGLSAIDFKKAEEMGYVKIDLLHNHVYQKVRDPDHLRQLVQTEPNWDLLEHREVVEQLFQLHDHYEIVKELRPRSLEELAMTIAIIRPGKRYLLGKNWYEIQKEIWTKTDDAYSFKQSHSYAYAMVIIVQLNLLVEELNS